jgi:hypothetical protein
MDLPHSTLKVTPSPHPNLRIKTYEKSKRFYENRRTWLYRSGLQVKKQSTQLPDGCHGNTDLSILIGKDLKYPLWSSSRLSVGCSGLNPTIEKPIHAVYFSKGIRLKKYSRSSFVLTDCIFYCMSSLIRELGQSNYPGPCTGQSRPGKERRCCQL